MVLYGFHPEEPLAEEVGKNLSEKYLQNVESIRFRPSYMPDNIHYLPEEETIAINLEGLKEMKNFVRSNYQARFILDLHETPLEVSSDHPRFTLPYPGANVKLGRALEHFREMYPEKIWTLGHQLKGWPSYHSATVEFYSKAKGEKGSILTKPEGERFVLDLSDYLELNYLGKI